MATDGFFSKIGNVLRSVFGKSNPVVPPRDIPVIHTRLPIYAYWPGDENHSPAFFGPKDEPSGEIRTRAAGSEKEKEP